MRILKYLLVIAIVVGASFFITKYLPSSSQDRYAYTIKIGGANLDVKIAETAEERGLGLGGRKSIKPNQGMLFIFEKPGVYPFWMRDMLFPLDIIWLDSDYKVIYIASNLEPSSYPQPFGPDLSSQYVVEVNAGWVEKNNVKIGDQASWNKL